MCTWRCTWTLLERVLDSVREHLGRVRKHRSVCLIWVRPVIELRELGRPTEPLIPPCPSTLEHEHPLLTEWYQFFLSENAWFGLTYTCTPVVRTVLWWRMVLPRARLRLLFWMPGRTPNLGLRQPGRDCRRADWGWNSDGEERKCGLCENHNRKLLLLYVQTKFQTMGGGRGCTLKAIHWGEGFHLPSFLSIIKKNWSSWVFFGCGFHRRKEWLNLSFSLKNWEQCSSFCDWKESAWLATFGCCLGQEGPGVGGQPPGPPVFSFFRGRYLGGARGRSDGGNYTGYLNPISTR